MRTKSRSTIVFTHPRFNALPVGRTLWRTVINAFRRYFIRNFIEYSRRNYPPTSTRLVLQLPGNTILKRGSESILVEAETMCFASEQTCIPVPEVLDAWVVDGDDGYMVMEKMGGETLEDMFGKLTHAQRHSIAQQLRGYIDQLRAIPQVENPGAICSITGGPFREDRIDWDEMGPFANEREYHDWRVGTVTKLFDRHPPTLERLSEIRHALRDDHPIVLTHADLNPGNILVDVRGNADEDARIVAIIDWGLSGWRPDYWEYVKLMNGMGDDAEWAEFAAEVLPACPEKKLDDALQRFAGEPF